MEDFKGNIEGILWLILMTVIVVEVSLYLGWNRNYFTFGVPIFVRNVPVHEMSLLTPSIEDIEAKFPKSFWGPSFEFKTIGQNEYAFRDALFEFRWFGFSAPPVMHGYLSYDNEKIVIKGYLIFIYPAFFGWIGLLFDPNLALILLPIFFGIPYLLQLIRINAVAAKATELFVPKHSLRECFKSGRVRLENDQIQPNLLDRSQVYRMATDFGVLSNFRNRSSSQMGKMAGDQCDSVRQSYRMSVADVARQFSSVANGVFLLLALATRWFVAAHQ